MKINTLIQIGMIATTCASIPLVSCNWKIKEPEPTCTNLCFSAIKGKGESSVSYETTKIALKGSIRSFAELKNIDIRYSYDGENWNPWEVNASYQSDPIVLNADDSDKTNDKVYVRNFTTTLSYADSSQGTHLLSFQNTGSVKASGNILSMINYSKNLTEHCLASLFSENASLTHAPALPATSLEGASDCYYYMFANRTNDCIY